MKLNWNKSGDWCPTLNEGPHYRHASGRALIIGSYGTLGDNGRGWRKTRCYKLQIDGKDTTFGGLKRLMEKAEKLLAKGAL